MSTTSLFKSVLLVGLFRLLVDVANAFFVQPPYRRSLRLSWVAGQDRQDVGYPLPELLPSGRVKDIEQWLRWSSKSLENLTGKNLLDRMEGCETLEDIHLSERYGVLSHSIQEDPIYNYFNAGSLLAFQFPTEEAAYIPSRYSAPGGEARTDRSALVQDSIDRGWLVFPKALRQTYAGEQFWITDIILWNVYDDDGNRVGQTAIYDRTKVEPVELDEN